MTPTPPTIGRRNALQSIAAITAIGVTGTGALVLGSEPARASVAASFDVPDGTWRDETGDLYSPWLQVTGDWSYANLEVDPTDWRIIVKVGQSLDNQDTLASTSGIPFGFDESAQFALQAPLIDAAAFDTTDFEAPGDGESTTVTVASTCRFEVLDGDHVLAEAEDSDTGALTIEDTSVSYTADLTANGSWAFQSNQSDATPTL